MKIDGPCIVYAGSKIGLYTIGNESFITKCTRLHMSKVNKLMSVVAVGYNRSEVQEQEFTFI